MTNRPERAARHATVAKPGPKTVRRIVDLRAAIAGWRRAGDSIGLVPTMGALHAGHLALLRQARRDCRRLVATIFVNPMQFNNPDDLGAYPRDEAADAARMTAEGVDLLFVPSVAEIYPPGFATKVSVAPLGGCLCGATRPGHMEGVATVVAKLLNQTLPDVAYFGEKDYQQFRIIGRMAADLDIPVRIAEVATVREADGFALSSRNQHLSPEQRRAAPARYRALLDAAAALAGGARPAGPVIDAARAAVAAAGFDPIDYLDLRAADDLAALESADRPSRVFAAAFLGGVRLIDNVAVPPRDS